MAEFTRPDDFTRPGSTAPRISAPPMAPARPMAPPPPILGTPAQPTNLIDMILQALSSAGPRFIDKAQNQLNSRMPQLDAKIAQMQANNAAQAQRIQQMPLGAQALDQAPPPAAPISPLELFGPPQTMPKAPGGVPSPQEFMQAHNARTPTRPPAPATPPVPSPQMPTQQPATPLAPMAPTQAVMPMPNIPGPPPSPAIGPLQQSAARDARLALILQALGEQNKPLEPNILPQRPPVPPSGVR